MTIEDEFADLMTSTVTIRRPSGARDLYTGQTIASAGEYQARIVSKNVTMRNDSGEEVVSRTHVYIFGAPGITTKDRLLLPDGTSPVILSVERYPDENGDHHEKVFLGGA